MSDLRAEAARLLALRDKAVVPPWSLTKEDSRRVQTEEGFRIANVYDGTERQHSMLAKDNAAFIASIHSAMSLIEALVKENEGLAAARTAYVEAADKFHGTPCEQIRWQHERENLLSALTQIRDSVPAFMNGEFFTEHHDESGNPTGVEQHNPVDIIQCMQSIADAAIRSTDKAGGGG